MAEKIITVSLNPASNAILWMDTLSAEQVNHVLNERTEPSGGALGISRLLSGLQTENLAVGSYGEDNCEQLIRLMDQYGIAHDFVPCKGETRQDITMLLPKNTVIKTTRAGFEVGVQGLHQIQDRIAAHCTEEENNIIVFSGHAPQNMELSELAQFMKNICGSSKRLALNVPGFSMEELRQLHPYLLMIRLQDLKEMTKVKFRNETTILRCMLSMTEDIEHVVVSLGAKGYLYAGKEDCCRIIQLQNKMNHPEQMDYFMAGFLSGLQRGLPLVEALFLGGGSSAWLCRMCQNHSAESPEPFSEAAAMEGKQHIVIEPMVELKS